jgi:hypothetical protein
VVPACSASILRSFDQSVASSITGAKVARADDGHGEPGRRRQPRPHHTIKTPLAEGLGSTTQLFQTPTRLAVVQTKN